MPNALAAVFHGPGAPWEFRSLECPSLAPGEVLVEISLATICGSDLHTLSGRRQEPTPCVLGHEAVGRVVGVGEGRDPEWLGRRVTWTLADSCGQCPACRQWDLPQKCERLFKYGHAPLDSGSGLNGCYASHVVLRPGTALIPLPDAVTDRMAAPANCALATMCAVTEPFSSGGELAVIQGAGLLGLYGCLLLRAAGWKRVVLVDRQASRLALAEAFGGEPVEAESAASLPENAAGLVIEVAGAPELVAQGIRWLRPGGVYAWAGMVHPHSQLQISGETVIRKCLTVRGTHNYAPRHLAAAVSFLANRALLHPWDRLVAPPRPLQELVDAIDLAESGVWPRVSLQP